MSNPDTFRGWFNLRLTCTRDPRLTGPAYDLTDAEVAARAILDADDALGDGGNADGVVLFDLTEWEAKRDPLGRLVLKCSALIEADSEEQAADALDAASAFVPGYSIEEWSTVPAEIDAD